jgi:Cys-tRNA(Pro) deacylase
MARSVDKVRDYFRAAGVDIIVQELPASTRTAQLAAEAVGTQVAQIVKSLVLITDNDRVILALVAGDQRADPGKIARAVGAASARMATGEEVRARTGYAIGGVPPVAHEGQVSVLIDATLTRFERVWAAAGAPNAVFEIETKKLIELSGGQLENITVVK